MKKYDINHFFERKIPLLGPKIAIVGSNADLLDKMLIC